MNVYRVRYLFTWVKELKNKCQESVCKYQESAWVSVSDDTDTIKQEFIATLCLNGDLVEEDVKILDIYPLGNLIKHSNGKLGVKYDFG